MAFSVLNNQPSAGCIQWSELNMQYLGESYAIQDGYTNAIYAYWTPEYPNNLIVSNTYPALGSDDCLVFLNKDGTAVVVPTATLLSGDLIVPGSILSNALAANSVTAGKIAADAVTAGTIASGAVTAGTVAADAIGASAIAAGVITGDKLVAGTIGAREINVSSLMADSALIGAVKATHIDVDDLFAAEATLGKVTTSHLAADIGANLDISSNESIALRVSAADLERFLRFTAATGLVLGDSNTTNYLQLLSSAINLYLQGDKVFYVEGPDVGAGGVAIERVLRFGAGKTVNGVYMPQVTLEQEADGSFSIG